MGERRHRSPWFTPREAAEYCRFFHKRSGEPSIKTIDYYVARERLKVHRLGSGKRAPRRFLKEDLDEFLMGQ